MNIDFILYLFFYWLAPFGVALGAFFILNNETKKIYRHYNLDRIWHSFIGISLSVAIVLAFLWLLNSWGVFTFVRTNYHNMVHLANTSKGFMHYWYIAVSYFLGFVNWVVSWFPPYLRAFVVVWFPMFIVQIQSLVWRIRLTYGMNVIMMTFLEACTGLFFFKYFWGFQTPMADKFFARLMKALMKENQNDALDWALRGKDDKGQAFQNGQGGSVSTQTSQQVALALRRTRVHVKTAAKKGGGYERVATIVVPFSREIEADGRLKSFLSGLGPKLSMPNIRFAENPEEDHETENGFVFASAVDYNAADALGGWLNIFVNPFSDESKVRNGGDGAWNTFKGVVKGVISYVIHLTPMAIARKTDQIIERKYTPDYSVEKAKYKAQQNLDLSVIPDPKDQATGNDIATQRLIAQKTAEKREEDIFTALRNNKFVGLSKDIGKGGSNVIVGGNTAVYSYNLPKSADIPTDFDKVATNMSNMLKMADVPMITMAAGKLTVTVVNGVNIPVDFKDMILKRNRGMAGIISGMAGVDALGKNIYFDLGDKNPHAMLFGKTGTGKTVTIMTILYSMMAAVDPSMLRIMYIDGKGNSFEFMRTDGDSPEAPNPYTLFQPADASGDVEYARALINHAVLVCRRRIDMFKKDNVTKLADYNKKHPEAPLPEILLVFDEFSAVTDQDKSIPPREYAEKNVVDKVEYLAKMSRSTGIRMLLANQTARKEKVPGKITANVTGRLSLGVSEPIESEIALPETGIKVHQVSQAGEFYSLMLGPTHPEHGNSPYLPDKQMQDLNWGLWKKFGPTEYDMTREEILAEYNGESPDDAKKEIEMPNPMPKDTDDPDTIIAAIKKYPDWAKENAGSPIFKIQPYLEAHPGREGRAKQKEVSDAVRAVGGSMMRRPGARSHMNARERTKEVGHGVNGGKI